MTSWSLPADDNHVIIAGVTGRFGKELHTVISDDYWPSGYPNWWTKVTYGLASINNSSLGQSFSTFTDENGTEVETFLISNFDDVRINQEKNTVLVDVSSVDNFENCLTFCSLNKIPYILASTGHTKEQLSNLNKLSKIVPVLLAPNLSEGITVFKEEVLKPVLHYASERGLDVVTGTSKEYSIKIKETHHKNKIDSPSGTALDLKEFIEKNQLYPYALTNPKVKIESIRDESSLGTHEVSFKWDDEEITLSHEAKDRKIFAAGIERALNIKDFKPGLYSMKEILFEGDDHLA